MVGSIANAVSNASKRKLSGSGDGWNLNEDGESEALDSPFYGEVDEGFHNQPDVKPPCLTFTMTQHLPQNPRVPCPPPPRPARNQLIFPGRALR